MENVLSPKQFDDNVTETLDLPARLCVTEQLSPTLSLCCLVSNGGGGTTPALQGCCESFGLDTSDDI